MRGSGMEADEGVAVAAFVERFERREIERLAAVALGDYEPAGCQYARERIRQLLREAPCLPVRRVQEDEVEALAGARQEGERVAAMDRGDEIERLQVGTHGSRVTVH